MTKIVIFKTSKRDVSGTTQLITIPNTVLESRKRALFVECSLSAKFEFSKSRNLIGRKFLNFFFRNFFLNIIKIYWLTSI